MQLFNTLVRVCYHPVASIYLIGPINAVNNVHVTVFLVSLKAGGVALNLTEASRVYLMDSWWNPAVSHKLNITYCTDITYDIQVEYRELFRFAVQVIRLQTVQRPWIAFIDWVNIDLCRRLSWS